MKKKDTMTIKDPTLLEVIKDNSVSFEKKIINHITAENVIVTSIDKWLFPNPKKMDELRDSIRLPIMQGIYGELRKDKHIHSNLYPPKVIITSNGKQENSLKKISFKAKMYKGEFNGVKEITELCLIHQVLQIIQQWLKLHDTLLKTSWQISNNNCYNIWIQGMKS